MFANARWIAQLGDALVAKEAFLAGIYVDAGKIAKIKMIFSSIRWVLVTNDCFFESSTVSLIFVNLLT